MGMCNGHLYAHDVKNGLFVFENETWSPLPVRSELPSNDLITAILPINKDSVLITTLKNGLFILSGNIITKLKTGNNSLFEKERIYAATKINRDWIALATNNYFLR